MDTDEQIMQKASFSLNTVLSVTIFVAALALVTLISIHVARRRSREMGPHEDDEADVAAIDEKALERFPMLLYSDANKLRIIGINNTNNDNNNGASCCSVCLGDYRDSDLLRMLPDCGHVFHQKCVDSWLRLRATCPLCRRLLPYNNNVVGGGGGGRGGGGGEA